MATERIIEHVERLRERPDHERHQIALGIAAGLTSIVAIGWATALASSGVLALKADEPLVEERTPEDELGESIARSGTAFSELMGAAGAAFSGEDPAAALRVIDSRTTSTIEEEPMPANNTEKTVIPF